VLTLRAANRAERATIIDMFGTGNPLLIRSVCPGAVDDVFMLPNAVNEDLVSDDAPAGPSHFLIEYQAITAELGPTNADPARTWLTLLADSATWQDVSDDYPTWQAVLAGEPS
jgi:hypothetical protein